ncbi:PKD domain-containing protein [bacterium]|nr:PKD domain-containing protein [bacterium]
MSDTDVCEGGTFEFYASVDPSGTSPPIYWSLDFGDGTPVIQDSLLGAPWEITENHDYSSTGTYTVQVIVNKPANLGTNFIIDTSFPSPTADPGDLAWDGSHLWLAAHTSSYDTIYEITTAGVVVSKINSPTVLPYGLAYDGSHLWVSVTSWPPGIYEITTAGAIVSGPLSCHGSQESMGLGWQGANRLWEVVAGASGHDSVYVTNVSSWSSPVGGFLLPRAWQEGCAYDNVHDLMWVCSWDAADPRIYGLNPATGAVEHSFSSPGSSPQGLAFDGICLWHSDKNTDMIYRLCFPVDEPGCADTDYVNVTVRPGPTAFASNDGPYCEGETINLFGYPDGMASYDWTGPDGFSSSSQNPTITGATALASGTYTLIVTDDYGCTDTANTDVTVYPSPAASASSSDSVYCVGDTIYLYGEPDGMTSYNWTGPNGFTSTLQNPIIPYADTLYSGIFTLTITDTNGCGDTASTAVLVELCCSPAMVWLECPTPFLQFFSCSSQVAIFGIHDTTGSAIDTMRVYCTVITRNSGIADTIHLSGASPYLNFSAWSDSISVTVHKIWANGDTVEISLDSIYNEMGCLTIP